MIKYLKYKKYVVKNNELERLLFSHRKNHIVQLGGSTYSSIVNAIKSFDNEIYKLININIDSNDLEIINNLSITTFDTFDYFSYEDIKFSKIKHFLKKICSTNSAKNINVLYKVIKRIYKSVVTGYASEAYWLSLRITPGSNVFEIPRWHVDGIFNLDHTTNIETKFIVTLKGDHNCGTKLFPMSSEEYEFFRNVNKNINTLSVSYIEKRKMLIEQMPLLNDKNRIIISKIGEGIIFQSVKSGTGAVHSEPHCTTSRIFLSILPSTVNALTEFKKRSKF